MERLSSLRTSLLSSAAAKDDLILVERLSDLRILHLNSPHNHNTLTLEMMNRLNTTLREADQDPSVKAIIIMGGGSCFSQGGDLSYFSKMTAASMLYKRAYSQIYEQIPKLKKPIIAAVHGFANGAAFDLALLCDMIVAESSALFAVSNIKAGFIGGAASSIILPKLIGRPRTMELILTGDPVKAETLHKWGALNSIVRCERAHAGQRVKQQAVILARTVTKFSRVVTLQAKSAIQMASDTNLQTGIKTERKIAYSLWGLKDTHEGIRAFLAKRKPQWTNS